MGFSRRCQAEIDAVRLTIGEACPTMNPVSGPLPVGLEGSEHRRCPLRFRVARMTLSFRRNTTSRLCRTLAAFCPFLLLLACATTQQTEGLTGAERAYREAMARFEAKDYTNAITAFETLRGSYPFSKYAIEADFMIGESYFRQGKYLESVVYYREFIKLHPRNEKVARARLQIGNAFFREAINLSLFLRIRHWLDPNEEELPISKDIANVVQASRAFETVIRDHPGTPEAEEARKRLAVCRKNLARHDLYVGKFYFRQEDYYSALLRFERIADRYPETPLAGEALYRTAMTYLRLHDPDAARKTLLRLAEKYPQSPYRASAETWLEKLSPR
ncbi:MAG: outer membrane protein assembly factor BamD [Deltaproteobacteria bacterium]|nr:MAG: outer membrane protein assembly factor BamD [Deltaproteobacteria bacterium]